MKLKHHFIDEENEKVIVIEKKVASSELDFSPGARFRYEGTDYFVIVILDYQKVMVRNLINGEIEHLNVVQIAKSAVQLHSTDDDVLDLTIIPDKDWNSAYSRFEIIRPILEAVDEFGKFKRHDAITARATECAVSVSTIKRWLARYRKYRRVTALIPKRRMDRGKHRLSKEVETIIAAVIRTSYLNNQKLSPAHIARETMDACLRQNVSPPHPNTVRRRIANLPPSISMKARRGEYEAKNRYDPLQVNDSAKWPLALVQIDHTLVDIMLVDERSRLPIARPWITVAIDVFSRMIVGFYLSFDHPNIAAVGICISNAIIPKDKIIIDSEIDADWPVWGKMDIIHVDNAKEFHSNALRKACDEHGINLDWRPVKQPHYGGHIERLLGTFATEIHTLPGTTFSNINVRKGYDSEKKSALTLKEFEHWLLMYILRVYHMRKHSALGVSPYEKYRQGIFGTEEQMGRGLPPRVMKEEKIKMDFMPFVERSIQRYGVSLDGIYYYSDSMRRWIGSKEQGKPRKFLFRRDPRDISVIWFYDPELREYFPIPYRDNTHPPISLWELRQAKKKLLQDNDKNRSSERELFEAREAMRQQVNEAVHKTKKARRHIARSVPLPATKQVDRHIPSGTEDFYAGINLADIRPYSMDEEND
ncbi:MAG: DDE-type integrase/transposase/recombinase [Gammaproteobacteria bacterium]|nr:DDE-type integrase/transposase/recombinase [Gammaproteobacteria bacterium]